MDDIKAKLDDLLGDLYWAGYDVGFEKADGRDGSDEQAKAEAIRREIDTLLDTLQKG